jgi:hypothetical protein
MESWNQNITPEEANNLKFVVDRLDERYYDTKSQEDRRMEYQQCAQVRPGVVEYTTQKENLYRMGYPDYNPYTDVVFRDEWYMKLNKKVKSKMEFMRLVKDRTFSQMLPDAIQVEAMLIKLDPAKYQATFRKKEPKKVPRLPPKVEPRKEKTPSPKKGDMHCYAYAKTGKCAKGDRCPFEHISAQDLEKRLSAQKAGRENSTGNLKQ